MKKTSILHVVLSFFYVSSFIYPVLFALCEINYDIYIALGRPFMIGQADGIMGGVFTSFIILAVSVALIGLVLRKRLFGGSLKEKILNTLLLLVNFIVMYFSVVFSISLSFSYPDLNYVSLVVIAVTVLLTLKMISGFSFRKKGV